MVFLSTITNANASPRATVLVGLLRSLFDTKKKKLKLTPLRRYSNGVLTYNINYT